MKSLIYLWGWQCKKLSLITKIFPINITDTLFSGRHYRAIYFHSHFLINQFDSITKKQSWVLLIFNCKRNNSNYPFFSFNSQFSSSQSHENFLNIHKLLLFNSCLNIHNQNKMEKQQKIMGSSWLLCEKRVADEKLLCTREYFFHNWIAIKFLLGAK